MGLQEVWTCDKAAVSKFTIKKMAKEQAFIW
jgi:hypothetical protein